MSLDMISPREVFQYIDQGSTVVIDLRSREAYRQKHIPGAISMPYDLFEENTSVLKKYKNIILYCDRGAASLFLGRKLSEAGYRVLSLGGGMESWRGPTVSA